MIIHLDDLIKHRKLDLELEEGADIKALIESISYGEYDMYHTVNDKLKRFDFKLSEGDNVCLIPVLGGG